jgi:predicted dehydrogenase
MVRVGLIGYGYWGPRVARNFQGLNGCELVAICERDPECLKRAHAAHPAAMLMTDIDEMLSGADIDAVAVITPVWTHFELAKKALDAGKHVFVEKPFTATVEQAEKLIDLAARKRLQIMVDHTFLFTGAVQKMRQLINEGVVGQLYYYDSMRVNLGLFQHDVNVIWDLAPHDLSIMDYLIASRPEVVVATGQRHFDGHEDVAYMTIYFNDNMIAHLNVNWLSPVKVRMTLLGGEKKMLVWNDLEADEKVKVYDRGVKISNGNGNGAGSRIGIHDLLVSYRSGDMWAPKVDQTEALKAETQYFVDCVENDKTPFNDGEAGLRVVKLLEAASKSLRARSEAVRV